MGREAFFHTVSGKGEVAKGIIVLRKGADPDVRLRLLHDRMEMQGTARQGRALGPRGVEPWPGAWVGLAPQRPGPPGSREREHGDLSLGGRLSCRERPGREPPAQVLWGSGCARPGEERKTTGGEGGSGRERERGTRGCRLGDPQPSGFLRSGKTGPSGSLRSGKTSFLLQPHAPRPGRSPASQPYSLCPLRAVLAPGMGRVTLGDLAAGLFPRAGHTSRHQRPSGWASQASALRPY